MKVNYDLHIHSALSPCADDNMTPVNICGFAKLKGLDMIAIADHNAIGNVEVALRVGKEYGITVVPAMELQTEEDIHILCLFESFEALKAFYNSLSFMDINNRPEIFGNQLIYDDENEAVGCEERLLLASANIRVDEVRERVLAYSGAAVPAHIDRDANSILTILGAVTEEFSAVELSKRANDMYIELYSESHYVIIDSDAHTLEEIGGSVLELPECSPKALIEYFNNKNK
ncbi:MAG: PHP domain-containing protein [Clostridia bacterium]|nr:PHP domain-containing protein [Clostridia bacterium]